MTAIQRFALHGTIMNPHSSGPYVRHEDHLAAMQGRCLAQIEEPAGAAPAAVAPQGEYPHEQMDAMALARYKVVPSHASMLWSHAVVAGHGAQQLYVGREVECQNMARKFAGAFLDGAFAFHSMAAAPTAQAAPALEAPAAPAVPPGFALVPLRLTRAMDEAISEEGWQWEDLLAAAQAVTEEQYEASAQDRLSQDEVRAIFLDCGFVIKEGQTDLKPYVYEAAQLLESRVRAIAAAAPQAPAAPSDAQLLSEWDRVSGITKATERRLACMRSVLQRWGSAAPAAPAVDADPLGLRDVGEAFMQAIERNSDALKAVGWTGPMDCPSEIVVDLLNLLEEANTTSALGEWVATLEVDSGGGLDYETVPPCTLPAGCYPLYRAAQAKEGGEAA